MFVILCYFFSSRSLEGPSQHTAFPPPSGNKIPHEAWKVLAILSSIAAMVMYGETMLVPAIPNLIKEFNITYSTSSSILTTYLLTGAVMTPIAGKISEIYGRKRVLLVIMIVYAARVLIAGFSTNKLVFGPASGFIISKVGSAKSIIIGTVVGFFGLSSRAPPLPPLVWYRSAPESFPQRQSSCYT